VKGPGLLTASELDVVEAGAGPPVVLVHGSVVGASSTWRGQLPLGARWHMRMPNRPGFARSPPLPRGDFELEAPLIAELLADGAHLVGHSYGAVIALFAAGLRPQAVRSLTLSEPGCLQVAAGIPAVDRALEGGRLLFSRAATLEPREFLLYFRGGAGVTRSTPEQLTDELAEGARLLMSERPPWEADPPWEELRRARFPKLVLSGAHSKVFEAVCDATARRIGARRAVVSGRGHTIPAADGYNAVLEEFLRDSEELRGG
jgi:pimeloyl-ACP methyl ester carboxylesterase